MSITTGAIKEFKNKFIKDISPISILEGIIYLLYLSHIEIGWIKLREKIECLIKDNPQNPAYACFKDIAHFDSYLEDYFIGRPGRRGWDLNGRIFFESRGWYDFKNGIEINLSHLRHPSDIKRVIKITNDLVKSL